MQHIQKYSYNVYYVKLMVNQKERVARRSFAYYSTCAFELAF